MNKGESASQGKSYRIWKSALYQKLLKRYSKKEPKLHEQVVDALEESWNAEKLDVIPGSGGWIKLRVASPAQGRGKSGGFRVIVYRFLGDGDLWLQLIYSKSDKSNLDKGEIADLAAIVPAVKAAIKASKLEEAKNEGEEKLGQDPLYKGGVQGELGRSGQGRQKTAPQGGGGRNARPAGS